MWVKILAGVGAALAVVSVGVFLAMPAGGWSDGKCGGTCDNTPAAASTSGDEECCGKGCCGDLPACCADETSKPEFGAGLAACLGGAATAPQPEQPQTATRVGSKSGRIAE